MEIKRKLVNVRHITKNGYHEFDFFNINDSLARFTINSIRLQQNYDYVIKNLDISAYSVEAQNGGPTMGIVPYTLPVLAPFRFYLDDNPAQNFLSKVVGVTSYAYNEVASATSFPINDNDVLGSDSGLNFGGTYGGYIIYQNDLQFRWDRIGSGSTAFELRRISTPTLIAEVSPWTYYTRIDPSVALNTATLQNVAKNDLDDISLFNVQGNTLNFHFIPSSNINRIREYFNYVINFDLEVYQPQWIP